MRWTGSLFTGPIESWIALEAACIVYEQMGLFMWLWRTKLSPEPVWCTVEQVRMSAPVDPLVV